MQRIVRDVAVLKIRSQAFHGRGQCKSCLRSHHTDAIINNPLAQHAHMPARCTCPSLWRKNKAPQRARQRCAPSWSGEQREPVSIPELSGHPAACAWRYASPWRLHAFSSPMHTPPAPPLAECLGIASRADVGRGLVHGLPDLALFRLAKLLIKPFVHHISLCAGRDHDGRDAVEGHGRCCRALPDRATPLRWLTPLQTRSHPSASLPP